MHTRDFYPMYHKAIAKSMSEGNILSPWRESCMISFNRHRVLTQSGFQICTPQSKSVNEQRSGIGPLPAPAESSSELQKIREEANRLEFEDASHALLNRALDLCSKANTSANCISNVIPNVRHRAPRRIRGSSYPTFAHQPLKKT